MNIKVGSIILLDGKIEVVRAICESEYVCKHMCDNYITCQPYQPDEYIYIVTRPYMGGRCLCWLTTENIDKNYYDVKVICE